MSFSKIKYFLFGILVSATLNIIITQANPDDGVFGVYFERMTGICPTNNIITSYSSGGVIGARECTPLIDLLRAVLGTTTFPDDSSVIGINADGTLKYKDNIWKENAGNISYTGNYVGIGTNLPNSKLDVVGGSIGTIGGNINIGSGTMAATVNISDTFSYFNGPYVGFGKDIANVPLDILGNMRISTNLDVQTIFLNTQPVLIPNNCSGNNVALQWTGNAWICVGI